MKISLDDSQYEWEINFDESYADIDCIDEWGAAFLWLDDNSGVEYNFCIDDSNCSAIYKTEINEDGYMETNYDKFIHYEVDFTDTQWEKKLVEAMTIAAESFFKRED